MTYGIDTDTVKHVAELDSCHCNASDTKSKKMFLRIQHYSVFKRQLVRVMVREIRFLENFCWWNGHR